VAAVVAAAVRAAAAVTRAFSEYTSTF